MAKAKAWEVTDEFWGRVEPLIPVRQRAQAQRSTLGMCRAMTIWKKNNCSADSRNKPSGLVYTARGQLNKSTLHSAG